jgi:GNAT superfamily N-acetyltransferase
MYNPSLSEFSLRELGITPVVTEAERLALLEFPWKVYRGDPYWVPPLLSERKAFTDPKQSPFFEHARVQFYLARRGDEIVGTIAAFTNDLYNEFHQANVGWFGFFEVLQDPEAAAGLLATAQGWARQAGHKTLLGPAQFSTNDEIGLLVDGFDDAPRILMTYNPRYYVEYIEAAGFHKAMDLLAYAASFDEIRAHGGLSPKLKRVVEKVKARGRFRVRPVHMWEFGKELERVKAVYNQSWERNWGFVPMTDAEIERMAAQLKPLIDPDLVSAVEVDGQVIGFGLTLPDLNQPLHKAYPRPGKPEWLTLLQLLWHWRIRRQVKWIRAVALGVVPQYRGKGVDALLYLYAAERAMRKGYAGAEMSWLLESNDMVLRSAEMLGGRCYKTYRVYEKQL